VSLDRQSQSSPFFTLFSAFSCATASSRPGGSDRPILEVRETSFSMLTTSRQHSVFPPPLSPLGLIATHPPLFLSSLSRSSHGRLLHLHGEAENHGRGAACSGRIQLLQEGAQREKDSTRDDKRHIDKTKKDQNTVLDHYVL
jgi:hypothetical protein